MFARYSFYDVECKLSRHQHVDAAHDHIQLMFFPNSSCRRRPSHRSALDHNDGMRAFDRATAALEVVDDDVELHTFVMEFAAANEERLAAHFAALDQ